MLQFPSVHVGDDQPPEVKATNDPSSSSVDRHTPSVSNDSSHVHITDLASHQGYPIHVIQLGPGTSSISEGSRENPIEIDGSSGCIETVLNKLSNQVIDQSSEYSISVNRITANSLWLPAMSFYKGALVHPNKLRRQLLVSFSETGEIGADSGALRKEFFEDTLKEMNVRLFDGEECTRIPKKDYNLEVHFEMAGMLVAHSLLRISMHE